MEEYAVLLHERPDLISDVVDLLNNEWRRNASRLETLKRSCDALPCSLLLVRSAKTSEDGLPKDDDGAHIVLAHCRLNRVVGRPNACWMESVVVQKERRGQGLGRRVVTEAEEYARRLGLKTMYLTTHDQEGFYGRLGYDFCLPVCISTASTLLQKNPLFQKLQLDHEMHAKATLDRPSSVKFNDGAKMWMMKLL